MAAVAENQGFNFNTLANQAAKNLPKASHVQRGLLVLSVACAAISIVPPLRLAGSLALRSVALLSSGVNVMDAWNKEGIVGKIAQIAKVAVVGLGIAGLAAAAPVVIAASLAADIAIQTFEAGRALIKGDPKGLINLGIAIIDSLALAAILTGSWELMVAAAAVSAVAMLAFALTAAYIGFVKDDPSYAVDALCYLALTGIGITGAVGSGQLNGLERTRNYFHGVNRFETEIKFYDSHGNVIATIPPGEQYHFNLPAEDCINGSVKGLYFKDGIPETINLKSVIVDFKPIITQHPITREDMPTMPVGGPTMVATLTEL